MLLTAGPYLIEVTKEREVKKKRKERLTAESYSGIHLLSSPGSPVSFLFLHLIFHMPLEHAQELQNHTLTVAMALSSSFGSFPTGTMIILTHSENGWIACPAAVWYWMHDKSLAEWSTLYGLLWQLRCCSSWICGHYTGSGLTRPLPWEVDLQHLATTLSTSQAFVVRIMFFYLICVSFWSVFTTCTWGTWWTTMIFLTSCHLTRREETQRIKVGSKFD